jgi:hypothetical protein
MRNRVIAIALCTTILTGQMFACMMGVAGLSRFDETEHVFIGEVIGHIDPVETKSLVEPAAGLRVRPVEIIYAPKTPLMHYEVFLLHHTSWCAPTGHKIDDLKKWFPIGSEIRVVAKSAMLVPRPETVARGDLPLEASYERRGSIGINKSPDGKRLSTKSSEFDYRSLPREAEYKEPHFAGLHNFEIRKDLLRLRLAKTQAERNEILERLAASPSIQLDSKVFEIYAGSPPDARRLTETHINTTNPSQVQEYRDFNAALDEMLRQGFDKSVSEQIIRGLQRGQGVKVRDELIRRSIEAYRRSFRQ